MPVDVTFHVQVPHRSGQLAQACATIAEHDGLIGDIVTVNLAPEQSIREFTIELRDPAHAWEVANALNALEGVKVLWHHDRAFIRHAGGKLDIVPREPVRTVQQMRDVYTPGVARICSAIAADPGLAKRYTMSGSTIAICTNGTRVLGLGDIGPLASMPVMEGKAVFYRQLAGLPAMPILIDTTDPDEFVETVVRIAPTFAGIHLEDIATPGAFEIERRLIERLTQPVMHDDVHGTAVVTLASVLTACKRTGRDLRTLTVGQLGLGAAGLGIASLLHDAGAKRVVAFDPMEASHARARERGIEPVDLQTALAADVLVATTGRPGSIAADALHPGQIVLALTNPYPEIDPAAAMAAGAAFAADGRSVNNVLGYPGIFRGALLAGAKQITVAMKLAAATAIADSAEEAELVPDALDPGVHERVAAAVRDAAVAEGEGHPERAALLEPLPTSSPARAGEAT